MSDRQDQLSTIAIMAAILMAGQPAHYAAMGAFGFNSAAEDAAKLYGTVGTLLVETERGE